MDNVTQNNDEQHVELLECSSCGSENVELEIHEGVGKQLYESYVCQNCGEEC